jgi:DNA polymerase-3 subunit epsilon
MREIVLDTETTGISIKDGHRIVEIGCIELDNLIPINKFHAYLNPERKVSDKAFEIHGYSDEFLSKQKKFSEIVNDFLNFIKGKNLIIHNAEFDITHLNNELSLIGESNISNKIIDTLELARLKFPGSSSSLDALCKRYRIDNSRRVQHTALIDCDLLAKVYINLIDQKEPTLNFKNEQNSEIYNSNSEAQYFKKIISPSKDEMLKHQQYLKKNLKKNYY